MHSSAINLASLAFFCFGVDAARVRRTASSSNSPGVDHAAHVQAASEWLTSKGFSVRPTTPVKITGQRNAGVTLLKTEQGETFVVKSVARMVHGNPNNETADLQRVLQFVAEASYAEKLEADPELPILTLPVKLQRDFYIMRAAQGKPVQNIIDDQSLEAFGKPRDPACGPAISAVKTALTKLNDLGIYHHDALTSNVYYDDSTGRVTLIDLPDIKGATSSAYSDVDRFTDSCETYLRTRAGKTPSKTEECGEFRSGATMTCIAQNAMSKPECRGRGSRTPATVPTQPTHALHGVNDARVQNRITDPCASLRAQYPNVEFDPKTGNCVVIRQQAHGQVAPQTQTDPCAHLRRQYPHVRWNGRNCVI